MALRDVYKRQQLIGKVAGSLHLLFDIAHVVAGGGTIHQHEAQGVGTVLDVYKRQLLKTAFSYAVEWDLIHKLPLPRDAPKVNIEERTIWAEKTMLAALQTIETVSYTHLDVYKRQLRVQGDAQSSLFHVFLL